MVSAREIVISTTDLKGDESRWRELFLPVSQSAKAVWKLGSGPAIHLVAGHADHIDRLIFEVRSLSQARAWLEQKKLLGGSTAAETDIAASAVQGLGIRLSER